MNNNKGVYKIIINKWTIRMYTQTPTNAFTHTYIDILLADIVCASINIYINRLDYVDKNVNKIELKHKNNKKQ